MSWLDGDWDVFLRRSDDGGGSWSEPQRLNDDPLGSGSHQYMPQVDMAPDGRVDAIFYDRRNNVENRGNDVYYTYSTDGGQGFRPNVRLSEVHFDSQIGPRYAVPSAVGLVEFGSRIALLSGDEKVVAAWTDTRNTGRAPRSQDIFATQILFSHSGGGPGWPGVVGGALAVAGLSGAGLAWRRRMGQQVQFR